MDQREFEAEGLLKWDGSASLLGTAAAFNGPDSGAGREAAAALCCNGVRGTTGAPDNTDIVLQAFDATQAKKDVLAPWMVSVAVVDSQPGVNGVQKDDNDHGGSKTKKEKPHPPTKKGSNGLSAYSACTNGGSPDLTHANSHSLDEEEHSGDSFDTGGFHESSEQEYRQQAQRRYSVEEARRMKALSQIDGPPAARPSQLAMPPLIARIVHSPWFDLAAACLLLTNAAVIGLQVEDGAYMHRSGADSEESSDSTPMEFEIVNSVFCGFFLMELVLRIAADGCREFLSQGFWSWFDMLVISVQVTETASTLLVMNKHHSVFSMAKYGDFGRIIRVARVIRVIRVFRVMRFFRAFRVLMTMIFGTMKNGAWATMLLMLIMYVFAIIFTQSTSDYLLVVGDSSSYYDTLVFYYGTVPRAVLTLFKAIIGGIDWENVVQPLTDVGPVCVFLFLLYIAFVQLVVMNVVTGFFLQSAIEQAAADQEQAVQMRLREKKIFVQRLNSLFEELDSSHDGSITLAEFRAHLQNEHMQALLQTFDIDDTDAWTLFKLLDSDEGGSVDLDEFVEGCIKLKGHAKSIQIAELMCQHKWMMDKLSEIMDIVSRNQECGKRTEQALKRQLKSFCSRDSFA